MARTAILALNNCMESCVSGIYDILTVASMEWQKSQREITINLFDLSVITPDGKPVTSFTGKTIHPTSGIGRNDQFDIVIIPVLYGDLTHLLEDSDLIPWLHNLSEKGVILCSVCAGTFLIAQTGLLNGKTATTHWGLSREFESRFPQVILNQERMIVDEGNFISAGGVTAYMDLSLYLAGRFGSPELISSLSKLLLIDPSRRLQTPYKAFDSNIHHPDEEIAKIQGWMGEHIDDQLTLESLAARAGLEKRTLVRRFKKATGSTPIVYLQNLRIGKARTLLETTDRSFDTITYEVGYSDVSSFRRLFKKTTGLSPSGYRKRFALG